MCDLIYRVSEPVGNRQTKLPTYRRAFGRKPNIRQQAHGNTTQGREGDQRRGGSLYRQLCNTPSSSTRNPPARAVEADILARARLKDLWVVCMCPLCESRASPPALGSTATETGSRSAPEPEHCRAAVWGRACRGVETYTADIGI